VIIIINLHEREMSHPEWMICK